MALRILENEERLWSRHYSSCPSAIRHTLKILTSSVRRTFLPSLQVFFCIDVLPTTCHFVCFWLLVAWPLPQAEKLLQTGWKSVWWPILIRSVTVARAEFHELCTCFPDCNVLLMKWQLPFWRHLLYTLWKDKIMGRVTVILRSRLKWKVSVTVTF